MPIQIRLIYIDKRGGREGERDCPRIYNWEYGPKSDTGSVKVFPSHVDDSETTQKVLSH